MPDVATPTPAPLETPGGVLPTAPAATEAESSLSAHIASLEPPPLEDSDDTPAPAPSARHHRVKDIATPADVPRIRELSAKVKAKDAEIAEWRAKYEAASQPAPVPTVATPAPSIPAATSTFTEAEPKLEQFQDKEDPYFAWQRATAAYDRRKEAFDAQQTQATKDAETQRTAAQQRETQDRQAMETQYFTRLKAFKEHAPDFEQKLQAAGNADISPLMGLAIMKLDNGPEIAYALFSRPDLMAEAHLMGDGKALTDTAVASAQRWLLSRVPTGTTGAVAANASTKPLPHPPTPVRTGPETPSDTPPGDDAGLAAHKRFYGASRRR